MTSANHTAAVNKNVLIDFSGSSLTNYIRKDIEPGNLQKDGVGYFYDVFQNCRYNSGSPVCGRCDNTPAARINFVHRNGVAR